MRGIARVILTRRSILVGIGVSQKNRTTKHIQVQWINPILRCLNPLIRPTLTIISTRRKHSSQCICARIILKKSYLIFVLLVVNPFARNVLFMDLIGIMKCRPREKLSSKLNPIWINAGRVCFHRFRPWMKLGRDIEDIWRILAKRIREKNNLFDFSWVI